MAGYASEGMEMGSDDARKSIENQLRKLDGIIAELGEVGKVLEDRLSPVLMQDMTIKLEEGGTAEDTIPRDINTDSTLYKYVQDQQKVVRRYVNQLRNIIERVQL